MATKRITDLPAAEAVTGDEFIEVAQVSTTIKVAGGTISAAAVDNSYSDTGAGFLLAGFAIGDRVNVVGFANPVNNIRVGTVTALSAGKMTIGGTDGDPIVDAVTGPTVTIAKWISRAAKTSDIGGSGSGVPDGGTTGQVLGKLSDDDGDADWIDQSGGGGGGGGTLTTLNPSLEATVSLESGWSSFGSGYGDLLVSKSGRVVTVTGLLTGPSNSAVFYLPEGYRPAQDQQFACPSSGSVVLVDVRSDDGEVHANGFTTYLGTNFSFLVPNEDAYNPEGASPGTDPIFVAGGAFVFNDEFADDFIDVHGCTVERISAGKYKITFDVPLEDDKYIVLANGKWANEETPHTTPLVGIDRGYAPSVTTDYFYLVAQESTSTSSYDARVSFAVAKSAAALGAFGGGGGSSDPKIQNPIDIPPTDPSDWDEEWDTEDSIVAPDGWTWYNRTGSGSTYNAGIQNRKLLIQQLSPTNGWNFAALCKPKPPGDFDIISKLTISGLSQDYVSIAPSIFDSVSGKFVTASFHARARGRFYISWNRWNGFNSLNTDNSCEVGTPTVYIRIKREGSSIQAYFSVDGEAWHSYVAPETEGSFISADWDQIGFFLKSENPTFPIKGVVHWIRDYQAAGLPVDRFA